MNIYRNSSALCLFGFMLLASSCQGSSTSSNPASTETYHSATVYFEVEMPNPVDNFVIKLDDSTAIDKARKISSGEEKSATHPLGSVVKTPATYNKPWTFYLDPKTIVFDYVLPAVCFYKYSTRDVEANLSLPTIRCWGVGTSIGLKEVSNTTMTK